MHGHVHSQVTHVQTLHGMAAEISGDSGYYSRYLCRRSAPGKRREPHRGHAGAGKSIGTSDDAEERPSCGRSALEATISTGGGSSSSRA